MGKSVSREEHLLEELKDPVFALGYLNESLTPLDDETPEQAKKIFLKALQRVLKAQGMSKVAKITGLNRTNLYQQIQENGRPGFDTVLSILESLGLNIQLVAKK